MPSTLGLQLFWNSLIVNPHRLNYEFLIYTLIWLNFLEDLMTRIVYQYYQYQQERQPVVWLMICSLSIIYWISRAPRMYTPEWQICLIFGGVLLYIAELGAAEVARSLIHHPSMEQENLVPRSRARKYHGGFIRAELHILQRRLTATTRIFMTGIKPCISASWFYRQRQWNSSGSNGPAYCGSLLHYIILWLTDHIINTRAVPKPYKTNNHMVLHTILSYLEWWMATDGHGWQSTKQQF